MSDGTWPAADERLVRRYRRLLLAYSGRYRRQHGTEMLTTILEMAEPSRSRPSAGEAWHVIASGLRQRFRLPSGRPFPVIAAVLVTVALGMFGAAGGSWLGVQTGADLPSRPDALHLLNAAVAHPATSHANRIHWSGRADSLVLGLYPTGHWTTQEARTGLTAAGWTITEFTTGPGKASVTCTTDAASEETCRFESPDTTVTAERDGLILYGTATDYLANKSGDAFIGGIGGNLVAARSPAYLPLTMAGGLLGALAGWLLAAALAYRMRSLPPGPGRLAAAFTGAALTLAAPPVWALIVNAVMVGQHLTDNGLVYILHAALRPDSHLDGVAAWLIPGCALAAAATAAIAVGILALAASRDEPAGATQPT